MKFSDLNTLLKKLLKTFEVICYLYIVLLLHKVFQFYPNRVSMDLDILSALFTDIPQCRLVFTSCAIWKNADLRNISALAHPKHYRWFSYECFLLASFCLDIHYELQQNSTSRFPPEGFQTFYIQFFAFSRYFGSI